MNCLTGVAVLRENKAGSPSSSTVSVGLCPHPSVLVLLLLCPTFLPTRVRHSMAIPRLRRITLMPQGIKF